MEQVMEQVTTRQAAREQVAVIDCDIHSAPANDEILYKYMPERWVRYHKQFGLRGHYGGAYPRAG